ncbi:hypothetical protein ES708_20919 [subsurface metagenome]
MKKILLIIVIVFCIFQMVVLAVAIDVGGEAIDRPDATTTNATYIFKTNPANASGVITSIEVWCNVSFEGFKVATFYKTNGNVFSTRDTHFIGTVVAGDKRIFSGLNININEGDYLGCYFTNYPNGKHELNKTGGQGYWLLTGDYIPCTDTTFTLSGNSTYVHSVYGIGTTEVAEEEENVIFFGTNF